MKLKIGDEAVTNKLITWDGGQIEEGTKGVIANIIAFKGKKKETYCVFNPDDTEEMLIININSVNKQ